MSDNDPFAEPDDADRTVIKPNPGGRRPAAVAPQVQPQATPDVAQTPSGQATGIPAGKGGTTEPSMDQGMTQCTVCFPLAVPVHGKKESKLSGTPQWCHSLSIRANRGMGRYEWGRSPRVQYG